MSSRTNSDSVILSLNGKNPPGAYGQTTPIIVNPTPFPHFILLHLTLMLGAIIPLLLGVFPLWYNIWPHIHTQCTALTPGYKNSTSPHYFVNPINQMLSFTSILRSMYLATMSDEWFFKYGVLFNFTYILGLSLSIFSTIRCHYFHTFIHNVWEVNPVIPLACMSFRGRAFDHNVC